MVREDVCAAIRRKGRLAVMRRGCMYGGGQTRKKWDGRAQDKDGLGSQDDTYDQAGRQKQQTRQDSRWDSSHSGLGSSGSRAQRPLILAFWKVIWLYDWMTRGQDKRQAV